MISEKNHRIMVKLTKEEMARATQEAKRRGVGIGAHLSSLVRDAWESVDRKPPSWAAPAGMMPGQNDGATD